MRHREFVLIGGSPPELNDTEHSAFILNLQKSIILSLEQRKLLNSSQREACLMELEKQYSQIQRKQR